jgi:RHS repeat-associated protein
MISFTPMVRLSTLVQGGPQAKPNLNLLVQATQAMMPPDKRNSADTLAALEMMQGMLQAMPEQARKIMEQDIEQAMQGGLTPQAQAMLGEEMAGQTNKALAGMRKGLQEIRQQEQTPVEIHFYHCDHLGTPLALTDRQGQIVWAAKYDPWGNIQEEFNPNNIEQNIRLPGQHHDKETGLYYNRHRYYDPKIGSYINQDPIGLLGGINNFTYASGDPVNRIDPYGTDDFGPIFNAICPGSSCSAPLPPQPQACNTSFGAGEKVNAFVNGAYSVVPGVGNALYQATRGAGLLGPQEYNRSVQETDVLLIGAQEAAKNRQQAYDIVKEVAITAYNNEPLLPYYFAGRLTMGILTGLGPAATLGDTLNGLEKGHNAIDAFVLKGIHGIPGQ